MASTINLDLESTDLVSSLCESFPEFSLTDLPTLLPKLINHVELFVELSATEKKDKIVNILKLLILKTDGPGDDSLWDPILISLVPSTVDVLLDVSSGKIKLNKKKNSVFKSCICKK